MLHHARRGIPPAHAHHRASWPTLANRASLPGWTMNCSFDDLPPQLELPARLLANYTELAAADLDALLDGWRPSAVAGLGAVAVVAALWSVQLLRGLASLRWKAVRFHTRHN